MKFWRGLKSLKFLFWGIDILFVTGILLIVTMTYLDFRKSLIEQKEREHYQVIEGMNNAINSFITRDLQQVRIIIPFLKHISSATMHQKSFFSDIISLEVLYSVDSHLKIRDFFYKKNNGNYRRDRDLSRSELTSHLYDVLHNNKENIFVCHDAVSSGKRSIVLMFPFKGRVLVAEMNFDRLLDIFKKNNLIKMYKDTIILLVEKGTDQLIYSTSGKISPGWEFRINPDSRVTINGEEYYYHSNVSEELNVEIVVLTSKKQYRDVIAALGKYFLISLMFIFLFFFLRTAWTRKSFYVPLTTFVKLIHQNAMQRIHLNSSYSEWELFERTYNNALKTITQFSKENEKLNMYLREIMDTSPDAIFIHDFNGNIIDVNDTCLAMYGYPKMEILSLNIGSISGSGYTQEIAKAKLNLVINGQNQDFEWVGKKKNGEEFPQIIRLRKMFIGNKKFILALVTNTTERKRTEQELNNTRNYLKNVFDSLSSVLVSIDERGIITQWNSTAEKYTGIPSEQAISSNLWELVPFMKKYQHIVGRVIDMNQPEELHYESTDGEQKQYAHISIYPLVFSGQSGAVIRLDDVTELRKKDEQLRQAQKMEIVGNLAGGLAHDFNNVLGGIIGTISLMQYYLKIKKHINIENFQDKLKMIDDSAKRASELVKQLLTLSRKQEFSFAPVDVNQAVKHVMKICESTFEKNITFDVHYYRDPAMVNADPTQIEQVLLNLCVNAWHAMTIMRGKESNQGGVLTLSVERFYTDQHFINTHPKAHSGYYWMISVRDVGVGMNAQMLAKIFEPFYTTKNKNSGTGLGLSIVYNIIEQHAGFVDVYSEEQVGSTFNIFLPVLEEVTPVSMLQTDESIYKGTGAILLVEDEEVMCDMAKSILEECGYLVYVARDGEDALDFYRDKYDEIDLIMLDMVMPRLPGNEAYHAMKQINPDLKVLLTSGFKQDVRVQDLLNAGVNGFIQKPYSIYELSKKIHHILT